MDNKEQIRELISQGQTEVALEMQAEQVKAALLRQTRFNGAKKQYVQGLMDFTEWLRSLAQINDAAPDLLPVASGE